MRNEIKEHDKNRLITICNNVENDFNSFSVQFESIEDFFIWRSEIKEEIEKR